MDKDGVLVVGSANMDLVVTTARFPDAGETILGNNFKSYPGGKGANQAVSCAKLQTKTFFLGKIGKDEFGERLRQSMNEVGLDLSYILTDPEAHTGTAFIVVDGKGQNEIIVIPGSNMMLRPEDIAKNEKLFSQVKIVIAQLEIPRATVLEVAKQCKKGGAKFILNPAPARELPEEIYPLIDYLVPNETELHILSGMEINGTESMKIAAQKLITLGVKNIIVTSGEKGALLVTQSHSEFFPAVKVKAVDSTAAGDAFNGALAHSLTEGNSINESIHFANRIAAISVTRKGAQSSMPSLNEISIS